jgi:hypothetical protein
MRVSLVCMALPNGALKSLIPNLRMQSNVPRKVVNANVRVVQRSIMVQIRMINWIQVKLT